MTDASRSNSLIVTPELLEVLSYCQGQVLSFSELEQINSGKLIIWSGVIVSRGYTASGLCDITIENNNAETLIFSNSDGGVDSSPESRTNWGGAYCAPVKNLNVFEDSFKEAFYDGKNVLAMWSSGSREIIKVVISIESVNSSNKAQTDDIFVPNQFRKRAKFARAQGPCSGCARCIQRQMKNLGKTRAEAQAVCCVLPACAGCTGQCG